MRLSPDVKTQKITFLTFVATVNWKKINMGHAIDNLTVTAQSFEHFAITGRYL